MPINGKKQSVQSNSGHPVDSMLHLMICKAYKREEVIYKEFPVNNCLLKRTVPVNNYLLRGPPFVSYRDEMIY